MNGLTHEESKLLEIIENARVEHANLDLLIKEKKAILGELEAVIAQKGGEFEAKKLQMASYADSHEEMLLERENKLSRDAQALSETQAAHRRLVADHEIRVADHRASVTDLGIKISEHAQHVAAAETRNHELDEKEAHLSVVENGLNILKAALEAEKNRYADISHELAAREQRLVDKEAWLAKESKELDIRKGNAGTAEAQNLSRADQLAIIHHDLESRRESLDAQEKRIAIAAGAVGEREAAATFKEHNLAEREAAASLRETELAALDKRLDRKEREILLKTQI